MAKKTNNQTFQTLEEIQLRKEQLKEVIQLEDQEVKRLLTALTTEEKNLSAGEQIGKYISYGIMAFDGVMALQKLKRNYGNLLGIFRRRRV